ncbi:MAG: spermidine synthase [Bryobacteraceae bacterium]
MYVYAATVFLSAFLLFQIQPVIGKTILPWFGGSAGVWAACMVFFQAVLLAGYLYADWLARRLPPRWQYTVHGTLLALSLAALPVAPNPAWKPDPQTEPVWRILGVLAGSVGLPYFILSTTSPLIQAWYARRFRTGLPYRLYALSNLASLAALLAYPVLIEPLVALRGQMIAWSAGYAGFVLLSAAAIWHSQPHSDPEPAALLPAVPAAAAPGWSSKLVWTALPACASALLLASTNYLCQDVAPIPFLWILPLSLYLLTFILCFDREDWYRPKLFRILLLPALAAMLFPPTAPQVCGLKPAVALMGAGLFLACMFCHGELSRLKPEAARLTTFYVCLALGGSLGGVFVSIIAPAAYRGNFELHVAAAACVVLALCLAYGGQASPGHVGAAFATLLLVASMGAAAHRFAGTDAVVLDRNFYGAIRVIDSGQGPARVRKLFHGSVQHGAQFTDAARRAWPTAYYNPRSGFALALASRGGRPVKVGVIGLGVGTVAAYAKPGDHYRFYEINPLVRRVAEAHFGFLREAAAHVEVALGDARLVLEREPAQNYDLLAVDAFSGDAIPVHLLTREALELYRRHLAPDGLIAMHISNRYLDLAPLAAALAKAAHLHARLVDSPADDGTGATRAVWAVLSRDPRVFETPVWQRHSRVIPARPGLRPWTDGYSNMFQILM